MEILSRGKTVLYPGRMPPLRKEKKSEQWGKEGWEEWREKKKEEDKRREILGRAGLSSRKTKT